MAGTRRSARVANSGSAPVYNEDVLEGKIPRSGSTKKRKTESGSSPAPKRGKKASEKQQTLEESLDDSNPAPAKGESTEDVELAEVIEKSKTQLSGPNGEHEASKPVPEPQKDTEMTDAPASTEKTEEPAPVDPKPAEEPPIQVEPEPTKPDSLAEHPVEIENRKGQPSATNGAPEEAKPSEDAPRAETNGTVAIKSTEEEPTSAATNGETAVETMAADHDTPASILEKGVLYFLFRGRVGIDDPQDVNDIARSFLVMRPLPHDAKLGDGPIGDSGNCRLLALPKKVLPTSGKDRFLSFVEKANTSFAELKGSFSASDYDTKTMGIRHLPPMTPVGEAVYAITTTGRNSHLAYILTIPDQLGEIQKDIGLKERGSFILSTKNPQTSAPANASLPQGPEYPKEILDEFRGLRWMPTQPKHLEYVNSQLLMIGESHGLDKATEAQPEDEKKDKDTPLQEMEKLEGEDEIRVKHLKGDDAVFADLDMSKKDFPKVPSTW